MLLREALVAFVAFAAFLSVAMHCKQALPMQTLALSLISLPWHSPSAVAAVGLMPTPIYPMPSHYVRSYSISRQVTKHPLNDAKALSTSYTMPSHYLAPAENPPTAKRTSIVQPTKTQRTVITQ